MNKTFQNIADELVELHERKDADYGNSFGDSYKFFGLAAPVIRLNDKMNRIKNIYDRPGQVSDETLRDTLVDLACYAIMTIVELDNE